MSARGFKKYLHLVYLHKVFIMNRSVRVCAPARVCEGGRWKTCCALGVLLWVEFLMLEVELNGTLSAFWVALSVLTTFLTLDHVPPRRHPSWPSLPRHPQAWWDMQWWVASSILDVRNSILYVIVIILIYSPALLLFSSCLHTVTT